MSASDEKPPDPHQEYVIWSQKLQMARPQPPEYVGIPVSDLQRLQEDVDKELPSQRGSLSAAYWALFGATVAIGVSIPAMVWAGMPAWEVATYITAAIAFMVIGLVLFFVDRDRTKRDRRSVSEIATRIRNLGRMQQDESGLEAEPVEGAEE